MLGDTWEVAQRLRVLQELVPEESKPSAHNGEAQGLNEMFETRQVPHGAADGLFNDVIDRSLEGDRAAQCCLRWPVYTTKRRSGYHAHA